LHLKLVVVGEFQNPSILYTNLKIVVLNFGISLSSFIRIANFVKDGESHWDVGSGGLGNNKAAPSRSTGRISLR